MEELKSLMLDSIEDVLTWIIGEKNILDNSLFAGQITNDQFKQKWEIAEKRALNAILTIKNNTRIPPATAGKSVDVEVIAKILRKPFREIEKQYYGQGFIEPEMCYATAIKEAIENGTL